MYVKLMQVTTEADAMKTEELNVPLLVAENKDRVKWDKSIELSSDTCVCVCVCVCMCVRVFVAFTMIRNNV